MKMVVMMDVVLTIDVYCTSSTGNQQSTVSEEEPIPSQCTAATSPPTSPATQPSTLGDYTVSVLAHNTYVC